MIFKSYPMDEQTCYFLLGSTAHLAISGQSFNLTELHFNISDQIGLLDYKYEVNRINNNTVG